MIESRVSFPHEDLTLEGVVALPEGTGPFPAVVVCHPHPLYGGNMDNNVVVPVCEALVEAAVASLRFNFRGVGASQGRFAQGIGEQEDVKAALTFLSSAEHIDPGSIGLCGYSFGASVVMPVAGGDPRVQAMALVSPLITLYTSLKWFTKPKLLICGSNDEVVTLAELQRFVDELPEPKDSEIIFGADHSWFGSEHKLAPKVASFFAAALRPPLRP